MISNYAANGMAALNTTVRQTVSRSLLADRTPVSISSESSSEVKRGNVLEVITIDTAGRTAEYLETLEPMLQKAN